MEVEVKGVTKVNRRRLKLSVVFLSVSVLIALIGSCFRVDSRARSMQPQLDRLGGYSSDHVEFEDISSFYKRVFGTDDDDYFRNWQDLNNFTPKLLPLERIPYMDSWYPEKNNGTNVKINDNEQGALDVYDLAFHGGNSKAADWENTYNNRQEPSWYGHCNGTSESRGAFQNPINAVKRPEGCQGQDCITFEAHHIRALLTEINMNARAKFIREIDAAKNPRRVGSRTSTPPRSADNERL